jgi:hypothetical protein
MDENSKTTLPTLNPDGTSVKGCNYIYAPRGQAGEYAPLAANLYRGEVQEPVRQGNRRRSWR